MTIHVPHIDPAFRALIPPLSAEEYSQLEYNIVTSKKCRDALVVWDGTLVDGHNRMEICARHGITFEIKEMDFASQDEAMIWILDNQLGRRNLNDAMRIELAIRKTELLRQCAKDKLSRIGGSKKRKRPGSISPGSVPPVCEGTGAQPVSLADRANAPLSDMYDSCSSGLSLSSKFNDGGIDVRKAVANEAGVSDGTVHHYMQVAKHGSPELQEAVKSGEVKIKTAYRLLDKELKKQLNLADKSFRFIARTLPKLRESAKVLPPDQLADDEEEIIQDISDRITRLLKQAEALKEAYSGKTTEHTACV